MDISELSKTEAQHLLKFHGDDLSMGDLFVIIEKHHDTLDDDELGNAVRKWATSSGDYGQLANGEFGRKLRTLIAR